MVELESLKGQVKEWKEKYDTIRIKRQVLVRFMSGRERPGQQFWPGRGIAPAGAGVYTMLYIVKYIAKQATCVITPHVNAVNGVM